MNSLSAPEIAILKEVCRQGGQTASIFKLSIELEMHYERCWKCVMKLSCEGYLHAQRSKAAGQGRGYILSLPCNLIEGRKPCKASEASKPCKGLQLQ